MEWNRYGTPASLIASDGWLTSAASGSASEVARGFIGSHRSLFKLSAADVSALNLVNDSKLVQSAGHAVVFRQKFGGQAAGHDGLITVGVANGRVAYVSSTAAGSQAAPAAATLTATQAWLRAGSTGVAASRPSVTISFAGAKPVASIGVSAMLDPDDADADEGRFTALRRFTVSSCDGRTANCSLPTSWKPLYTSPSDAFPSVAPRPLAPDLTLRTFDVADTTATQIRFTATRQPVHGRSGLPGRAGRGPAQPDRLRHRVGPGHVPARRRARGVLAERDRIGGRVGLGGHERQPAPLGRTAGEARRRGGGADRRGR